MTEYERRSQFNEYMKTMDKNGCIEVARILKKHNVAVSENRSGMFFDLATIPQPAFEDLLKYKEFIEANQKNLERVQVPSSKKVERGGLR
jgi:hypothetical protein